MGRVRGSVLLASAMALSGGGLVLSPAAGAAGGLFHPYVTYQPGSSAANVAVGDLTGDGRSDVLLTTDYEFDQARDWSLWLYPQQSDGTLGEPTQLRTGGTYWSHMAVALADLDEDGDLDAAVTTKAGVEIFEQRPEGLTYDWTVPIEEGHDLELADVSGDGLADLVVNTQYGIEVWWQIFGDFMPAQAGSPLLSTEFATEVEVADVTGDGRDDVVSATGGTIEVRAQQPDHSFAAPVSYASGGLDGWTSVNGLAVGDTNGDGLVDVHASVGGNKPNSWVVTLFQLSDGTLAKPYLRESYDIPETLEVADVTGDGRGDLVTLHGGHNRMGVYDSTPGIAPYETLYPIPYASHYDAKALAVGDVSGDGRSDVAIADYNYGLVLLRGAGSTPAEPDTTITSGPTGTIRSTSATFGFSSTQATAYFECSLDDSTWQRCSSPTTYADLATATTHTFQVRGVDAEGLVDGTPAKRSFTVDAAADLVLSSFSATPDPVKRGSTLTYTARVVNAGPDTATDVVFSQGLPEGVRFESVSAALDAPLSTTASCTGSDSTVRCAVNGLDRSDWLTVTVTATVTASKGSLSSTAVVTTPTWDLDQDNDTASTYTKVGGGNNGGGKGR